MNKIICRLCVSSIILLVNVIFIPNVFALNWVSHTGPGAHAWIAITSSADGTKLAAVALNDYIYTSDDSGTTWTRRDIAGLRKWSAIISSSDGSKLVAAAQDDYIYTSTDSGESWTQRIDAGVGNWKSISSSADGTKLAATKFGEYIYTSTDSGETWTAQLGTAGKNWLFITSSANGTKLAVVESGNYIYTSSNSGVTWTPMTTAGARAWLGITSSSDGTKLAAVVNWGSIYTSSDSGENWTEQTNAGTHGWRSIANSSDGVRLIAVPDAGYIYTSADSGETWTEDTSLGRLTPFYVTSSSDGTKVAFVNYDSYIYTAAIDSTAPVFLDLSPTTGSSIKSISVNSSVSYTLSEAITKGLITASSTGGTADPVIHSCTLTGTALALGVHTALDLTNITNGCSSPMSLTDGSIYVFSFGSATDAAGNVSATTTIENITYDSTAPAISNVTWTDADNSTDINGGDNIVITFSENMATTTATSTNVNTVLGLSNSHSFGTSPAAVWTGATVLTVTLDNDATVESGDTINPASEVTDVAGNADASTATAITDNIGPSTPVASLTAGTYTTFKNITTLTSEYSTDIHFTNDGTTPNCYSTVYTNPINVNHSFTLKAVGCDTYKNESSVLTVVYVVDVPVSGGGGGGGHGRNPRAAKPATPAVPNVSSAVPAVPNSQNISNSSAVPSQTVNSRNFTKDLSVGSSGDEVVQLQTFLEDGGYLIMPLGVSKGYYGTLTKNAVIKFQRASGLPTPGKVGPMTRSILNLGN